MMIEDFFENPDLVEATIMQNMKGVGEKPYRIDYWVTEGGQRKHFLHSDVESPEAGEAILRQLGYSSEASLETAVSKGQKTLEPGFDEAWKAAVRDPETGQIFSAEFHADAIDSARRAGSKADFGNIDEAMMFENQGFLDTKGNFVSYNEHDELSELIRLDPGPTPELSKAVEKATEFVMPKTKPTFRPAIRYIDPETGKEVIKGSENWYGIHAQLFNEIPDEAFRTKLMIQDGDAMRLAAQGERVPSPAGFIDERGRFYERYEADDVIEHFLGPQDKGWPLHSSDLVDPRFPE